MARLLIVHHSPTDTVRSLTDAVVAGAHDDAIEDVEVVVRPALEASAADVLGADGVLLGTTANFGYMSGALKHFFDTIFLEAGGALVEDGSAAAAARCRSACGCTDGTTRRVRSGRSCRSPGRCRGRARPRCWRWSARSATRSARRRTTWAARWPRCCPTRGTIARSG